MKKSLLSILLCLALLISSNTLITTAAVSVSVPEGYNNPSWSYQYETTEYGYKKLIGVIYQGTYYVYLYDDVGMIEGILDADRNPIAKYEYDQYGLVVNTYSNENHEWVINEDPDFIGNKNKMLGSGMFFDEATNCYYINERYFDPVLNKYMDGTDDNSVFASTNPYLRMENGIMPIDDSVVVNDRVTRWADELLSNSSYGCPINQYSSNWYSSLSDVEVIARAIYCEGGVEYTREEDAVARVVLNRIYDAGFPDTPVDVVEQPSQFSSITGGESSTKYARIPTTNSDLWRHSTYLACLFMTTTENSYWSRLVGNPISNQVGFYSYSSAKGKTIFYDSDSKLMYNSKEIKNVYVVGYGGVGSFDTLFNNYSPTPWSRNIYYNYK